MTDKSTVKNDRKLNSGVKNVVLSKKGDGKGTIEVAPEVAEQYKKNGWVEDKASAPAIKPESDK